MAVILVGRHSGFHQMGPHAGVSISIPVYRYDDSRHADYARMIKDTAAAITKALANVVR